MLQIALNTPVADNGGTRRDAGESLTIGAAANEITAERAETLIGAGSATDTTPAAKSATKPD